MVLCFSLFHERDHLIHWHFGCCGCLELSCQSFLRFFCLCLLCLGLVLLCLVPVSSCGLTRLRTDCSMLHFRTPKEGYSVCTCVIRSLSTTMCDDLARATEAQDGKKSSYVQTLRKSQNFFLFDLPDKQIDRQTDRQTRRQREREREREK